MAKKYTIERNLVLNQVKEGGTEDRVIVIDENNEVSSVPRSEFGAQDLQSVLDNGNIAIGSIQLKNIYDSEQTLSLYDNNIQFTTSLDGGKVIGYGDITEAGASNTFNLPAKPEGTYTLATTDDITSPITIENGDSLFSTGLSAGSDATGAYRSNFIGFLTGNNATNAGDSNFIGTQAGGNATDANNSNFFGFYAGNGATNASYSNFLGINAGQDATNANSSNFFGNGAGNGATNASESNFIGGGTGFEATEASLSNFIGYSTGSGATNANNSNFIGYNTGFGATNASFSNLLGHRVGLSFTDNSLGSNNIIIGTNISLPDASANSINLGGVVFGFNTNDDLTNDPKIVATTDGRVAIGTNTDDGVNRLQVNGNIKADGFVKEGGTSTEFLMADGSVSTDTGGGNWGSITGTLGDQTDLQDALDLKANLASPTFTGTVSGITKSMVGLGNVDDTSDASKPISTATQTALGLKANLSGGNSFNGDQTITGATTITGLATLGSGSANHFTLAGSATNPILSTIGSAASIDMLIRPKGNGQVVVGAGGWAYATAASGAGSLLLNNGTSDAPNLKFAYGNNQNFAIDVAANTLRFIVNSDESGGAVIGSISTAGALTMNSSIRGSSLIKNGATATNLLRADGSDVAPPTITSLGGITASSTDTLTNKSISGSTNTLSNIPQSAVTNLESNLLAKQDALVSGTTIKTIEGQSLLGSGNIDLTKTDVGLGNVDNTSDLNKPISTATQTALNLKANLASPNLTGTPTAPTAAQGTNTNQIATTEFANNNSIINALIFG